MILPLIIISLAERHPASEWVVPKRREQFVPRSGQGGTSAQDPVTRFFAALEKRGREPLLMRVAGTLRFDLGDDGSVERWYVTVNRGRLEVSRRRPEADAVWAVERGVFVDMTEGRVNPTAATLRGDLQLAGDVALAMAFQRILPGPPGAVGPDTPSHPASQP
jgi:putative sterol carrier protein